MGTSKAERKALIKSKAYEAKLKALEQEKEQMNRRSNGKSIFFSRNGNFKIRKAKDLRERRGIF